jgi:hypothetical protein
MARTRAVTKSRPSGTYDWTIVEIFGMYVWAVNCTRGRKTSRVAGGTESSLESAQAALDQAVSLITAQEGAA